MPLQLQEFVAQFKTRKNLRLTLKNAFVCFGSSKGDNGFESILRTVPTIVTAHIFCACRGSRATRKKCATGGLVLSPASLEGCTYFFWKS